MKQIVTGHNTHIIKTNKQEQEQTNTKTCSCKKAKKNSSILGGKCILEGIIYQATVKESETNNTNPFKIRYGNHLKSFRHKKYSSDSELSKQGGKQVLYNFLENYR